MRIFLWVSFLMYATNGLSTVILGSVLPLLLAHYGSSYAFGGLIVFFQFIGFLFGVITSAVVVRLIKYRGTLILASICIAVAVGGIGFLPPFPIVSALSFVNGVGLALTQSTIASSVMEWFQGRRAVVMSRLEVAFGIGALFMPLLESQFIKLQEWSVGFWFIGLVSIILAISWSFAPIRVGKVETDGPGDSTNRDFTVKNLRAKTVLMMLFLTMIFVYVGIESCVNNFLPSIFLSRFRVGPSAASVTVTVFWSSMVIGRALTGWTIRRISYSCFLSSSVVATLSFLTVLALVQSTGLAYVVIFLIGVSMSGIFVVTMVFTNHAFPTQGQKVTRFVTGFAGLGGATLPVFFGWLMNHLTAEEDLVVIIICTLALLLLHVAVLSLDFVARRGTTFDGGLK